MEMTLENKIRTTTRALLDELLETVEKETAGLKDDTSSRLKQASDRIRAKLEVIDEFDRYAEVCTKVRKTVDDVMKEHRGTIRVPLNPDLQPNTTHPDKYVPKDEPAGGWPPPYWDDHTTWLDKKGWAEFNPSQFPCECNPSQFPCECNPSQFPCEAAPDTTGSKPPVWKPCVSGTTETYNVMYSNKTDGGMQ